MVQASKDEPPPRAGYPPDGQRIVRGTSVSAMSALLLQGWKMCAATCPDCGVPLMQHPGDGHMLCVNCDQRTEPETSPAPPTPKANGGAPPPAVAVQKQQQQQQPQAPSSSSSDGGGQQRGDGVDGDDDDGTARREQEQAAEFRKRGAASDRVSAALGERMLAGWALLDRYCPRCMTPLVRSRQARELFCVSCDCRVVDQSEQQAQQAAPTQQQQQRQTQQPSGAAAVPPLPQQLMAPPPPAEEALTPVGVAAEQAGVAAKRQRLVHAAVPMAENGVAVGSGSSALGLQQEPAVLRMQRRLLAMLDLVEGRLAAADVADAEGCSRQLRLARELMDTLSQATAL